jgi:hypothetical protein
MRSARPFHEHRDRLVLVPGLIQRGQERLAATPGFRLGCERDEEERIFMLAQNNFTASFRLIPGWDQRTGRRMVKNQWL